MKMLYLNSKTDRRRVVRLLVPMAPVVLVLILVGGSFTMPSALVGAGHTLARPLWSARDTIIATVVATYESLESTDALVRENTALHDELSALRRENFNARAIMRENEMLRVLAGRTESQSSLVPAAVINNESFSPYGSFVIDIGTGGGVHEDMMVLSSEGIAVGFVTESFTKSATVTLFSAPNVSADVVVQASTTVHARMKGEGGGTMMFSVPRDLVISVGDVVVLPTFVGNPLGSITVIESAPEAAYKVAYVSGEVNPYEIRYVLVDTIHTWRPDAVESGGKRAEML